MPEQTGMTLTQKLLSYLFPTTRKIPSAYNGILEVTVFQGRKVLDSANANYSYGSLQRILRTALLQLDLAAVRTVLLLGLGGGSVVATLRAELGFRGHITAVELDPVVIRLAAEEFGIAASDELRIVHDDALDFVRTDPGRYDLVIVDLFIDTTVPAGFMAAPFWRLVGQRTAAAGQVVFNAMAAPAALRSVRGELGQLGFAVRELAVEGTNTLLLASRPAA
ncbi:spermidine synthase [Hymenobacter terricola]|uniref:spermidine synthase n=1 Tax=Hymenobacter terricola TaxID=2819236 RepID=UPI001B309B32|nr:fused MFS/spermidine synthase [Hymenobacter terricola]